MARRRGGRGRRWTEEKTELETLEGMFTAVSGEVQERERFLEEMATAGNRQYEAQIRAEVSARVVELRKIDTMIKDLAQGNRSSGGQAAG